MSQTATSVDPDEAFLRTLREEMHQTRARRFQYQLAKVTSVGSLMGVSALVSKGQVIDLFYYAIPFVAFAFDLFVLGESFTLQRLSAFVRMFRQRSAGAELAWEAFVKGNPDQLGALANLLASACCAVGSATILALNDRNPAAWMGHPWNAGWVIVVALTCLGTFACHIRATGRKWAVPSSPSIGSASSQLGTLPRFGPDPLEP